MRLNKLVIIVVNYFCIASFSMHGNNSTEPRDIVKKILSYHARDLYDFDGKKYADIKDNRKFLEELKEISQNNQLTKEQKELKNAQVLGAQIEFKRAQRLERLNKLKIDFIKAEKIAMLEDRIAKEMEINKVKGYDKETISTFAKAIIEEMVTYGLELTIGLPATAADYILNDRFNRKVNITKSIFNAGYDLLFSSPKAYEETVKELENDIRDILSALANDNLIEIERNIVKKWDSFHYGSKEEIIKIFAGLRDINTSSENYLEAKDQIEKIINLPTELKQIVPGYTKDMSKEDFKKARDRHVEEVFSKDIWRNFSPKTLSELKSAFIEICNEPYKKLRGKKTSRKILYLHGPPGLGKTYAAQKFAEALGVPVAKLDTTKMDQETLLGISGYSFLTRKMGLVYEPLFKKDKEGNNWKNPVVIIEEFDRTFRGGEVDPFILELFDPDKEEFPSTYFGNDVPINIADMIFICTSNSALEDEYSNQKKPNMSLKTIDPFEALRDRMIFIEFDGFTLDTRKSMLKSYIDDRDLMNLSSAFGESSQDELIATQNKMINYIIKLNPDQKTSLRKDHKLARKLVNSPESKWKEVAKGIGNKPEKNPWKEVRATTAKNKGLSLSKPCGIGNWGGSCYFNAMAQLLFASKSFVAGMCSEDATSCKAIKNFVTALKDKNVDAKKLKKESKPVIEKFGFSCDVPSNPEEIGTELLKFAQVPPVKIVETMTPYKNGYCSKQIRAEAKPENMLAIDVGKEATTLQALLESFSIENRKKDEQYIIPKRGKSDYAGHKKLIAQLQDEIFFIVNRYREDQAETIKSVVALPNNEIVDLKTLMAPEIEEQKEETRYRLKGIIVYSDNANNNSYHISYVRYGEKWYKCNDENCEEINYIVMKADKELRTGSSIILLERLPKNELKEKLTALQDYVRKNKISTLSAAGMGINGLLPRGNLDKLAVASLNDRKLNIYWIAPDGAIEEAYWYSHMTNWGSIKILPAGTASSQAGITAVVRDENNFDVFYITPKGAVMVMSRNDTTRAWQNSEIAPENSAADNSDITAVSRKANTIEIFWVTKEGIIKNAHWYENLNNANKVWVKYSMPMAKTSPGAGLASISRIADGIDFWWVTPEGQLKSAYWYESEAQKSWQQGATFEDLAQQSRVVAFSDASTNVEARWLGKDQVPHGASWEHKRGLKYLPCPEDAVCENIFKDSIPVPDYTKSSVAIGAGNDVKYYFIDVDKNIRELLSNEVIDNYRNTIQIIAHEDNLYKLIDCGSIYKYDFDSKKWKDLWGNDLAPHQDALKIAISPDGILYKIFKTHRNSIYGGAIMKFDNERQKWRYFEDKNIKDTIDIAISTNGDVYKIDKSNSLYRYNMKSNTVELLSEFDVVSLGERAEWVTKKTKDEKAYRCSIDEL